MIENRANECGLVLETGMR